MHRCPQAPADEDSPPPQIKLSKLWREGIGYWTKKNTCCNTHVSHLGVIYFYKNILEGILSKDCLICTRKFKMFVNVKKQQKEAEEASFRWPALLPKLQLGLFTCFSLVFSLSFFFIPACLMFFTRLFCVPLYYLCIVLNCAAGEIFSLKRSLF